MHLWASIASAVRLAFAAGWSACPCCGADGDELRSAMSFVLCRICGRSWRVTEDPCPPVLCNYVDCSGGGRAVVRQVFMRPREIDRENRALVASPYRWIQFRVTGGRL